MKKSKMTKANAKDHGKLLAQSPLSSRFSRKEGASPRARGNQNAKASTRS